MKALSCEADWHVLAAPPRRPRSCWCRRRCPPGASPRLTRSSMLSVRLLGRLPEVVLVLRHFAILRFAWRRGSRAAAGARLLRPSPRPVGLLGEPVVVESAAAPGALVDASVPAPRPRRLELPLGLADARPRLAHHRQEALVVAEAEERHAGERRVRTGRAGRRPRRGSPRAQSTWWPIRCFFGLTLTRPCVTHMSRVDRPTCGAGSR